VICTVLTCQDILLDFCYNSLSIHHPVVICHFCIFWFRHNPSSIPMMEKHPAKWDVSSIHHWSIIFNHHEITKNHHETTLLNHPIKPAFFPSPMIQWSQWSQWSQVTWLRSPGFHLIRLCTRDLWFHVVGGYGGAVLQVPGGRCLGRSS
jgi:hypothetical protein